MSKNYGNYSNREIRRQQERKNGQSYNNGLSQQFSNIKPIRRNNNVSVDVEQEDEQLCYWMDYKNESYEINAGYLTYLGIVQIQENANKDKRNGKYDSSRDLIDFDKILRLAFADGEYDRFFKNNPKISIDEIAKVSMSISKLIMTNGDELEDEEESAEDTSFRE